VPPQPVYSRILLKLSGEALAGSRGFGLDAEKVSEIAGELAEGREQMRRAYDAGHQVRLVAADELSAEALVSCPYGVGAMTVGDEAAYGGRSFADEHPGVLAVRALAEHLGSDFAALICGELGGTSIADAFYPAAMLGLPIVDADPVGRAVPELEHSLFYVHGVPIAPQAVVNEIGDTVLITRVAADASDPFALAEATGAADALYNCANPPYHRWPELWPPMATAMLEVAARSGAVLVTMGNLYGYGPVDHALREDDPLAATGTKGRVRVAMWEEALAAHRAGRVRGVGEVALADHAHDGLQGRHHGPRGRNDAGAADGAAPRVVGARARDHELCRPGQGQDATRILQEDGAFLICCEGCDRITHFNRFA